MKPAVEAAVEEIREAFPDATVEVHPDAEGGAHVIVDPVELGDQYEPSTSWIGFHITFQYPVSDCYPHFVRSDLKRKDEAELGEAMSVGTFGLDGRAAVQISRRSNRLNPAHDTALTKLWKVLEWTASR
jgi:hypothetical protein